MESSKTVFVDLKSWKRVETERQGAQLVRLLRSIADKERACIPNLGVSTFGADTWSIGENRYRNHSEKQARTAFIA